MKKTMKGIAAAVLLLLLSIPVMAADVSVKLPVSVARDGSGRVCSILLNPLADAPAPKERVLEIQEGEGAAFEFAFAAPGTYRYEISQVQESVPGLIQDRSVYHVTVYVTEEEGSLTAAVTAQKNDEEEKQSLVSFRNDYRDPTYKPPYTGDSGHLALWLGAGFASAVLAWMLVVMKKKREKQERIKEGMA